MSGKRHYQYMDIVEKIASDKTWGRTFESQQEAERHLVDEPDRLMAFTMLQLLAAFKRFCNAMADDPRTSTWDTFKSKPDDDAGVFLNSKVGDVLWHGDFESGFYQDVIVAMDDAGHARTCSFGARYGIGKDNAFVQCDWASKSMFPTLAEAIADVARSDIKYHEQRLKYAQKALSAVQDNEPLDDLIPAGDFDDD